MTRILALLAGAALAAIAAVPAADAFAGASCFDACSGPPGQTPCGSGFLGCPPEGGQCINCRDNNDCQPGGFCNGGLCFGLPCTPDTGVGPPIDAGGELDSGGGPNDSSGPSDSAPLIDTGVVGPPGDASV